MDSCFALSINAQVLTTSTSASAALRVNSCPAFRASPSMTSESTRFFGHPRETIPIFMATNYQLPTANYGYSLYSIRGYGIVSRTCSSLQIQETQRSIPMPKPPCGTVP